jgi:GNAT superfamily N-acetyltransferase
VGWLHVYGVALLRDDGYAEVGGVVVDAALRRQGAGRRLLERAEAWAAAHGHRELRLRSGLQPAEAHEFYRRIGYELTKTSHMFRRPL